MTSERTGEHTQTHTLWDDFHVVIHDCSGGYSSNQACDRRRIFVRIRPARTVCWWERFTSKMSTILLLFVRATVCWKWCDEYVDVYLQTTTNHYWWEVCFLGAHGILPSVRAKRICSTERCGEWLGPSRRRRLPRNAPPRPSPAQAHTDGGVSAVARGRLRRRLSDASLRARGGCVRTGNARQRWRARAPDPTPPGATAAAVAAPSP